ncbi:hypothetical protein PGT21_027416 [Puccinia graminis f. sp. tritici]|uniref:Uncharacterized protein n=1 Tax=Puccinia graminis f. sp. tritici TaxID=56615 RepID=A0A5B0RSW3_PUCGR|nr:hypothetical protein PGT21_027416 [Puccinia graminis f. sp. tritici]KAA1128398.1 hypothetical protein PGTUg99_021013 [Puccinia graminis f. sp. tritici]
MGLNQNRAEAMGPALPNSAPAAVSSFPRSPPPSSFPAARPHLHLPSRLRPTGQVTRSNALRRATGPALDLKDIPINGDLVNKALGLTPTSPPTPTPLTQIPPMPTSSLNSSTLPLPPLPPIARPPRRGPVAPAPRRRNAMIILVPQDLPQELRDIQLDASMTQDDHST